ncbi:hypothetical protein C9I98_01485 [Photobacterium sanctipauli]|uniref:LysR substrate-binding domain-containing protein n=1 Tax=Photobacterium sanctipauli TaxID=1342794 RepID=A0A2T3P0B3_9GAMM|nr:LysR substrate-binding domain-containing protein [Photobacterium sanctipauli]PSW21963.1 hypothetical protein C9I98_01485 [Photobacterium sanctipauli]
MSNHPEISVDLHFDDRSVDLIEHGFDIGIGTSINEDSRLIARQLFSTGVGVYAAPSYLEHYGEPQSLTVPASGAWVSGCLNKKSKLGKLFLS